MWDTSDPRVCGGAVSCYGRLPLCRGLSPRVRGSRGQRCIGRSSSGSIPACAGEPGSRGREGTAIGVYPRVCGGAPRGSSGRSCLAARGETQRCTESGECASGRSAPAGKVRPCLTRREEGRILGIWQPRTASSPSEQRSQAGCIAARMQRGLSPRAARGSIPACAGEPIDREAAC